MRYLSLILALAFLGGLLISSQALTAGQPLSRDAQQVAALSGEDLRQWHLAQDRVQSSNQMQALERIDSRQLTREQVVELQRQLDKQGYSISRFDGIIGSETRGAIQSFQTNEGLTLTGMPNQETLETLILSTSQQEFFGLAPEFGVDEE